MAQTKTDSPLENTGKINKRYLLILFGLVLFFAWLLNTPPGLLGKADAVGYAVCHRISSHSYFFADRPFSLCARCTGQYLGFLWGFAVHLVLAKKRVGFPRRPYVYLLGILILAFFFDGINSVVSLYPGIERWSIYDPLNVIRLLTGLGMGLAISAFLYPLAGQTILNNYSSRPALNQGKEWLLVFSGAAVLGLLILTGNPLVLYPIILLSSVGLIVLLMILYMVIWILITKRENSFGNLRGLFWWGLAGLISALVQIMIVDGLRYLLTGTWSGFLDY